MNIRQKSRAAVSTLRRRAHNEQRTDIPASAFPDRRARRADAAPVNCFARTTRALGWVSAGMAAVLLVLVVTAIHNGREVRDSATDIVTNLHTVNNYFDKRADLTAPQRARAELAELAGVLGELDRLTAHNADRVAEMLPDAKKLVAAGSGDVTIAHQLRDLTSGLAGAAQQINSTAGSADGSVAQIDTALAKAIELVTQLNSELKRTTDKLAPLPAQGALIPAPGGQR
ncbi:hypothetical protein LTT66_31910 [Nocardia gipuzkoensis]|uniref:hypothetical protein n=1 Tax=Nocardia gipuzkoensis TaxID=2749991 RepID=UPI001E51FD66|nr:hypothetical protein [Nocardia gipuzkoensis]UGT67751.1 hypothetical protein LTT66_31910 [Nocardia gipuzkoensis]